MKLISCDNCATIFDADKLPFPTDIESENGSINDLIALWDGENWVPKVNCPVCDFDIAGEAL